MAPAGIDVTYRISHKKPSDASWKSLTTSDTSKILKRPYFSNFQLKVRAIFQVNDQKRAGPIYEIEHAPGKVYTVDLKDPNASDESCNPCKTISAAASLVSPGETVFIRKGIYRESVNVRIKKGATKENPITFVGEDRLKTIITGAKVLSKPWFHKGGNVYQVVLPKRVTEPGAAFNRQLHISPADQRKVARPDNTEPLSLVLGQLFMNDAPLKQVTTESKLQGKKGSWYVTSNGKALRVHLPKGVSDPTKEKWEIVDQKDLFAPYNRGVKNIHLKGISFHKAANPGPFPQRGAVSTRSGRNWRIEHCIIRWANTIGLDIGSETWDAPSLEGTKDSQKKLLYGGNHFVFDNDISDNGMTGIAGWVAQGNRIVGNRIERNNWARYDHEGKPQVEWHEWAGIKIHGSDAVIEDNFIKDNHAFGIWYDNGYKNARVIGNTILNNTGAGVYIEFGKGGQVIIADNTIIGAKKEGSWLSGQAIYTVDASEVVIVHNLFANIENEALKFRLVSERPPKVTTNHYIEYGVERGVEYTFADWKSKTGRDSKSKQATSGLLSLNLETLDLLYQLPNEWETLKPVGIPVVGGQPLLVDYKRVGPSWLTSEGSGSLKSLGIASP